MVIERKVVHKVGMPPGALLYVGKNRDVPTTIDVMQYDADSLSERKVEDHQTFLTEQIQSLTTNQEKVCWINVNGLNDVSLMRQFGQCLGLDPLVLEDILNTEQRPKMEVFANHIFFTLKMLRHKTDAKKVDVEQVSFILGPGFVVSFQERAGDVFDLVRTRLRKKWGGLRFKGADYLLYSLTDVIVDNYFLVLESVSHSVSKIEERILSERYEGQEIPKVIQANKKLILTVQRSIYPLRESINKLQHNEGQLLDDRNVKYFNDVHDHTIQVIESIENFRDMNLGLQDVYHSTLSNKMNQVMQMLTIISTIFIPLTFIAGVYGMNFRDMPEIEWRYGYHFAWTLMVVIAIVLLLFFKRKRWI